MAKLTALDDVSGVEIKIETFGEYLSFKNEMDNRRIHVEFEGQDYRGEEWLFKELGGTEEVLEEFFSEVENYDEDRMARLYFLCSELGYTYESAVDRVDEVQLTKDTPKQYVEDILDELYEVPQGLRSYINTEALAEDMQSEGSLRQFDFEGVSYVCTNANDF